MTAELSLAPDYAVLKIAGADATKFLQGQLSNDVSRLQGGHGQLTAIHNQQGRTLAILRLLCLTLDVYLAVLPRELLEHVKARLSKYVLRARVQLSDASDEWWPLGRLDSSSRSPGGDLSMPWAATSRRQLVLRPRKPAEGHIVIDSAARDALEWRRLDIEEGVSQIRMATSERFVAQMLNLDALGGLAFDKGCYTGQEIIARAHFRGRVKRRAQRFVLPAAAANALDATAFAAAAAGRMTDGRSYEVLDATRAPSGDIEALLVTTVAGAAGGAPDDPAGPSTELLPWRELPPAFALPWEPP